ncbi:MAG TPA: acetyl-CoA carboxylase biotin carboxylase subunit [Candidatus Dormibacteraeota bacterium]
MGAFRSVLIANRGEIAVRVIRACRDLGLRSVAVYSEADRGALHVRLADEAVEIGPAIPSESYLNLDRVIAAARQSGAEAIHPGYGFLSENPLLAEACAGAGLTFVGPPASAMQAMGDKVRARRRMEEAGVPVVPGTEAISDLAEARARALEIGFPILVKASAGGGGIGMREASDEAELEAAITSCQESAQRFFGDPRVFLERLVADPRHIEIQVLADSQGNTIHLGERECSIQRRHQKLVEECPSTAISPTVREEMGQAAIKAAKAVGYVNAGTVEFIESHGSFYFLEMNTRLQVEHPVTELVTGIDLVAAQLAVAQGEPLAWRQEQIEWRGWAIECRINAEDPFHDFQPTPGRVTAYHEPSGAGVRVDSSLAGTGTVSPYYDPMVAKLIVSGASREQAIGRARRALYEYLIGGITTNIPFHAALLEEPDFRQGHLTTAFIPNHPDLLPRAAAWRDEQPQALRQLGSDGRRVAAIAAAVSAAQ